MQPSMQNSDSKQELQLMNRILHGEDTQPEDRDHDQEFANQKSVYFNSNLVPDRDDNNHDTNQNFKECKEIGLDELIAEYEQTLARTQKRDRAKDAMIRHHEYTRFEDKLHISQNSNRKSITHHEKRSLTETSPKSKDCCPTIVSHQ